VARAVAYAHGRLVVHRDLKPSNVLVTADGQARLLDFGIAKLLHEAGAGSDLTQEQGRVLTPQYASPEQFEGATITVASDVYSLGVLLYELLTGRHPYATQRKSVAAMEEAILEGEPPLASDKASDKTTARQLRGELDAILAKALRRDPARRYATADAFANDVERHLGGERVLAQPDSLAYRIRKTLQRHRAAFAATGAIAMAVLSGTAISIVQAKRANDAAERARVVKEFVVDVFRVNERGQTGNRELRQLPAELLLERGARLI
jgi:serine/threonine-protein kinase